MLPNEQFALACRAYYEEQGLIVDEFNGEFAHSPLTRHGCDTGYYLTHEHHQHQGLLQSKDLGECCFFPYYTLKWLKECDYWPDNYFDLWDTYEKYAKEHAIVAAKKSNKEKDENGKSAGAARGGKKGGKKIHEKKNESGKSLQGIENAKRLNAQKDENGKSLQGIENAKRMLSQVWESTVDGFRSTPGAVAQYNRARGWDPAARVKVSDGFTNL